MQKVIDGEDTFLRWREVAAREPGNAEALWQLLGRQAMHDMPEEAAPTREALAAIPPERNPHAYDLLVDAIRGRDAESAKRLIRAGLDPKDTRCQEGLSLAIDEQMDEVAAALLEGGADFAAPGRSGATHLHRAALQGRLRIAGLLIDAGADVNARDRWKRTPLACAILAWSRDTARLLVARGAEASADELARIEAMPAERRLVKEPDSIRSVTVAADGALFWARGYGASRLVRHDPATGRTETSLRNLWNLRSVSACGDGVYLAEGGTDGKGFLDGRISRLDLPTGRVTTILDGINYVQCVSAAPGGGIAFVDVGPEGTRLRRLRPGAREPETLLEGAFVGAVATDHRGRTVASVLEKKRRRLVAISADGSERETLADGLPTVGHLAFDGAGNCFVATSRGSGEASGILVLPAGGTGGTVTLRSGVGASGICVGPGGTVYYSTHEGEVRALEVDVAKALGRPGKTE